MIRASLLFVALTLVVTGCSKKEEGGGAAGKPAAGKAAAAPAGPTKLPVVGLVIEVPGQVTIDKAIIGTGDMLMGEGVGAMQVEIVETPQTLDEAKSDAEMFSPKNLNAETLPDGWALTFENKGSMGANYFVDVRREIDGKVYKCHTTGAVKAQADAVLAACKTLKKG